MKLSLACLVVILCFISCNHNGPKAVVAAVPQETFSCGETTDCKCEKVAINAAGNNGLWGGKPSFKATLTAEAWVRFENAVKDSNLVPACKARVLLEAAELPEGKPVTLNLLIFAIKAEVYSKER